MDIDRSYSHRGHYQERKGENEERRSYGEDYEGETGVKVYLKRVLSSLANEFWKVGYVTGFHCFVNAMYRSQLEEDEAYMFASFLLRDMRCEQLYLNGL